MLFLASYEQFGRRIYNDLTLKRNKLKGLVQQMAKKMKLPLAIVEYKGHANQIIPLRISEIFWG
jgi:hypothetical protein